ncbi:adrenocorticotropic hormone receptor-like [Exaiptasia diaphana]|uniref:G-protein coupled receptors family 1 profile domain-containing protein n=1 Tax=Exaiptasia diaphana TaxID=2652724 RepID=A0A913WQS6_EXADI|nr:adrenocorticotropic hormone receptor-like [Exaiptasia diaphana]
MDPNWTSLCPPMQTYFLNIPRDVSYDYYLLVVTSLSIFLSLIATLSNSIVVFTLLKTPSLRTPSNFLIVGLAVSDFSTGVVVLPSFISYKVSEHARDVHVFCPTGMLYVATGTALSMISFLTLSTITADRFLAVQLHLRYKQYVTTKRYAFLLFLYWGFCIFIVVCRFRFFNSYTLMTGIVLLSLFLAMDAFFILKVSKVVHRHSVQIQAQHQQSTEQPLDMARFKKTVNVMYYIIGAFVLCYMPLLAALVVLFINSDFSLEIRGWFTIAELFLLSNAAVNPVIYCFRIKEIRDAFKKLLPKRRH